MNIHLRNFSYINEYSQNALAMKLLGDMDAMYEQFKDSL